MGGTYLTVPEFRAAPTAVPTGDLVYGGTGLDQDVELARTIQRASDRITAYCTQDLVASSRTTYQRVRFNRFGEVALHPGEFPLVSVSALSVGTAANNLTAVSASSLAAGYVDPDAASFILPASAGGSFSGAGTTTIQLSAPRAGAKVLVQYTYVAGYPSTTLAANAAASATSITVTSSAGIVAGTVLTIVDGSATENVTVTATPTTTAVAVTALTNAHTAGTAPSNQVAVHAMTTDLRQAAIWLTAAFIQTRGNDALNMGQIQSAGPTGGGMDPTTAANLRLVKDILDSGGYKRIR